MRHHMATRRMEVSPYCVVLGMGIILAVLNRFRLLVGWERVLVDLFLKKSHGSECLGWKG